MEVAPPWLAALADLWTCVLGTKKRLCAMVASTSTSLPEILVRIGIIPSIPVLMDRYAFVCS